MEDDIQNYSLTIMFRGRPAVCKMKTNLVLTEQYDTFQLWPPRDILSSQPVN